MNEKDKAKQRLLTIPLSERLSKTLEQLAIATAHIEEENDKDTPNH